MTEVQGAAPEKPEILAQVLQAALGIAALHFPVRQEDGMTVVAIRHVEFLLDGHVDAWLSWPRLPLDRARQIARLLRHRPAELASDEAVTALLRVLLLADQLPGCRMLDEGDGSLVAVTPGMPMSDFVDATLDELDALRLARQRCVPIAKPGEYETVLRVTTADPGAYHTVEARYRLRSPDGKPWAEQPAPRVLDALAAEQLTVPAAELLELAARLDELVDGQTGGGYRAYHVGRLLRRLRGPGGSVGAALGLMAGPTQILQAPTGSGKSVLMEAFACWTATRGLVVTLVVPTNNDVLQLAYALERDLAVLGSAVDVTPLMSPAAMFAAAEAVARQRPAWDPTGEWTYRRLGYGCALIAAASTEESVDAWRPGHEPCVKLRPSSSGDRRRPPAHACPWRATCGKFRLARAACTASVLITTHANLHFGRVHLPVDDGHGVTDRMTVEELVFRRSHVVVIDEVDAFQDAALDQSARGLVVDHAGRSDTPLRQLDSEFAGVLGRLHAEVDADVRDAIAHSRFLGESYVSSLVHGRLGPARQRARMPGPGRAWLVPRRWDGWLTARLFQLPEDAKLTPELIQKFRSLFPHEGPPCDNEPNVFPSLRQVLRQVTEVGGGADVLERSRAELDHLLSGTVSDEERDRVVDRLLRRAHLERLRHRLLGFVHHASQLSAGGVQAAQEIADALGPYSRWRVTPNGPLGRLLFAFTEFYDPTRPRDTRLRVAAFGGDPHVYTTTLGDTTALCHAGVRRIVIGLSATAYLPGAPHHHVHAQPTWWVPDEDPHGVRVLAAPISAAKQQLVRVSGKSGRDREQALRVMGRLLWTCRLEHELNQLAADPATHERARVLLATTSYDGARYLAEGLVEAGVPAGRICLAVRPQPGTTADDYEGGLHQAGRWWELPADRVEEFPAIKGADILIAPLARVQRGVNIIGVADQSAIGSVWLVVRPIPLVDEPAELLAHVNAHALAMHPAAKDPITVLHMRRSAAGRHFEDIVTSLPYFRSTPEDVKLAITAEIVLGVIQLVGRARRGGTPATIYLADGAFLDPTVGPDLASLIRRLRDRWHNDGVLDRLRELYGTTLDAFLTYADMAAPSPSASTGVHSTKD
jgi:hypothetical protein